MGLLPGSRLEAEVGLPWQQLWQHMIVAGQPRFLPVASIKLPGAAGTTLFGAIE